jgi:NAD(P)-dependent dehydrogenase (short-subunit alcohol dehydrogenase family)
MRVAVIDGQGGGIGKHIVEQLRKRMPDLEIVALGTNALATGAMLKAGATEGASGESAICFNVDRVDLIIGSFAIVTVYGMLGEITPAMAAAISSSTADKLLLPIQRSNVTIVGVARMPLPHQVEILVDEVAKRSAVKLSIENEKTPHNTLTNKILKVKIKTY